MSRLYISVPDRAKSTLEMLYKDLERRIEASPEASCPVDLASSFLKLCHAQTCGKCVPCRIGLGQLQILLDQVLNHEAEEKTLDLIEKTARVILNSADCAIGYEAAKMVLKGLEGFRDDYLSHIVDGKCLSNQTQPVPCVAFCPAKVDIPGYIALIAAERYNDAVSLIRKDNPFPTACAFVCEHPCEMRCRRKMIDDAINIRGLKRYAVDNAKDIKPPKKATKTGKKIAVIGGGPAGLSAAYYLSLMGHEVTVYEKRKQLGGMLLYGIPSYRLPRERLKEDIDHILSTGVQVKTDIEIGKDIPMSKLKKDFNAIYIAIGAHADKKMGIEGEDKIGVISAVDMLRNAGDGFPIDFSGKKVAVIGGGNVAMDVTRSAIRLGASKVTVAYRRRIEDMTALPEEIEGAIAEGAEILQLHSPIRIESNGDDEVTGLWVQPQIVGKFDKSGRPSPVKANLPPKHIPCDYVIIAIGQLIEYKHFAEEDLPVKWGILAAEKDTSFRESEGIFAGGDCITGPATVIRAIEAGKVGAANIDEYLGYNHIISTDIEIPRVRFEDKPPCGRVNMTERPAKDRKNDFELLENGMTDEEAKQESNRCLRCDHFGFGSFKGGRIRRW